jgi:alpha-L-fucosidase
MYQPTWDSVATHPLPDWYDDAKLGVFLHWGLYSVPGWAPQVPDRQFVPYSLSCAKIGLFL